MAVFVALDQTVPHRFIDTSHEQTQAGVTIMSGQIAAWHAEHLNFARLLGLFEAQVVRFAGLGARILETVELTVNGAELPQGDGEPAAAAISAH